MNDKFAEIADEVYKEAFDRSKKQSSFASLNECLNIFEDKEHYTIKISSIKEPESVSYTANGNFLSLEYEEMLCINLGFKKMPVNPENVDFSGSAVESSFSDGTLTVILRKK